MSACEYEVLSTEEASRILNFAATEELANFRKKPEFGFWACAKNTFYHNPHSPVSWVGLVLICAEVGLLFWGFTLGTHFRDRTIFAEGVICLVFLTLVVVVCTREEYLRRLELIKNIEGVFDSKHGAMFGKPSLSLSVPSTPAVSLVWTYRDKVLVNLPWNLLVEGDVILLGPSAVAPAKVKELCPEGKFLHCPVVLDAGVVFNPPYLNDRGNFNSKRLLFNVHWKPCCTF